MIQQLTVYQMDFITLLKLTHHQILRESMVLVDFCSIITNKKLPLVLNGMDSDSLIKWVIFSS